MYNWLPMLQLFMCLKNITKIYHSIILSVERTLSGASDEEGCEEIGTAVLGPSTASPNLCKCPNCYLSGETYRGVIKLR